jgi:hypothetical protein
VSDRTRPPQPTPGLGVIINGPSPHDWMDRYETVAILTLAALPLAALTIWALARRRRHAGSTTTAAWRTSLAEVGILHGTLPWLWLTMLPANSGRDAHGPVCLVPLRDLTTMPTYQIVGNLLIFMALGVFAPLRFTALQSIPRILAVAAACSILIETAQYVLKLDRVSSVDDVLLNTSGAGLAALASRRWWRKATGWPNARPQSSGARTGLRGGPIAHSRRSDVPPTGTDAAHISAFIRNRRTHRSWH